MGNLRLGDWVVEIPGHTPTPGDIGTADILGTTYQTVIMPDGKEWLAENLMKYGTGPRYPADHTTNESLRLQLDAYGALYLWSEVLALPLTDGWRLPTPTEWAGVLALVSSPLNLKLTATGGWWDPGTPWQSPNTGALGSLGLNMQAAGSYLDEYWHENVSQSGYIHLSDGSSYYLAYGGGYGQNVASPTRRMSVRLVRDPTPPTYRSGTHDLLILPSGQAETTESLAQRVDVRLRTFFGEHWLNPELGVPWFRDFLTKAPDLAACRQILYDTIRGVRGVQTVNALTLSLSKGPRILSITFAVNGTDPFTSTIPV